MKNFGLAKAQRTLISSHEQHRLYGLFSRKGAKNAKKFSLNQELLANLAA